jgi:hypothetical protein
MYGRAAQRIPSAEGTQRWSKINLQWKATAFVNAEWKY